MKYSIIYLISTFALLTNINSQCIIEAGMNRNLCPEEIQNSPTLQGEIISGDVVEIKWESQYYQSQLDKYYYASIMLNDTSVLNPIIELHFEKTVMYFLTGITSNNETCTDSVELNFSDWTFLTIDKVTGKMPSDTIQLWIAAESNWQHIRYEWSPNYMISDTTVEKPFVWNDTTVFYNLIITDSLGCSVTDDVFQVYSNSSSTNEEKEININIFPNPTTNHLTIESPDPINYVEILDSNGNLCSRETSTELDLSTYKYGTYILKINFSNGNVKFRKIIKLGSQ